MDYTIVYPDELYHHGIKGQRWGIRRFQNYDGSLKRAGIAHFKALASKTKSGAASVKRRIKNKPIQSAQSKVYQKTMHMSKKDADEAARKKAETMKKVAIGVGIGAAVVGAGVGVYAYHKMGKGYFDSTIKAGTTFQTLSKEKDRLDNGRAWFTAHRESDKQLYVAKFSEDSAYDSKGWPIKRGKYILQAQSDKPIKVMGERNGKKLFDKMYKENPEFKNLLDKANAENFHKAHPYDNYKNFNHHVTVSKRENSRAAMEMFSEEAKKRGYGAIADLNDRATGKTKKEIRTQANIIIDNSNFKKNSSGGITKDGIRRVTDGERDAAFNKWQKSYDRSQKIERFVNNDLLKVGAATAAGAMATGAAAYDARVAYKNAKSRNVSEKEKKNRKRK